MDATTPQQRRAECLAKLGDLPYELVEHAECNTLELLAEALKDKVQPGDCILKNLFQTDKKKKQFLVIAPMAALTHAKVVAPKICAQQPLRFGSPDRLWDGLKVIQGSVSILSILNNTKGDIKLCVDEAVKASPYIYAHPDDSTASLRIKTDDVFTYLHAKGIEIEWMDLSNAEAELAEAEKNKGPAPGEKAVKKAQPKKAAKKEVEGSAELGITMKKTDDFAEWYSQVITKAELIDYYDISGCYVLRPAAYFMWETIQRFMDDEIKLDDVQNTYFPMFVTKAALEKEADHVEGFSPEVAWVTKSGSSDMAEPIAIRPTSETIMYPVFSRWIRSHRDLPLKINQWCPVVRWEFKQPTPFIRTREFLWQEGHTAHATTDEAMEMVLSKIELYRKTYEEVLAVPATVGFKSTKERFAGGYQTTTVENFIPANGRAVQGGTSHHLGQNFSKMFNIQFETESKTKEFAHQTSWGFTTRSIGVAIMVHGDDKGLVSPPMVAQVQAVLVPIVFKENPTVVEKCKELEKALKGVKVRAKADTRDNYNPGWKYNHWETKGVPLRIELGPKDLEKQQVVAVRRDTGEKIPIAWDAITTEVPALLKTIQSEMYQRAKLIYDASIVQTTNKDDIMPALLAKKLVLVPWVDDIAAEEEIKGWTAAEFQKLVDAGQSDSTGGMKSLCFPVDQPPMPAGTQCFWSGKPAEKWCLFGKSY